MQLTLNLPLKPRSDNFTPLSRTPWGGTRIAQLKSHLGVPIGQKIGESWEISGHPDFPNIFQIENEQITLLELLKKYPEKILGKRNLERFGPQMPFLAKLLNAEDWLSVQVHPKPNYPNLKPGEHSKTEAWHIIEAQEGAGIYLGLAEGTTPEKMKKALTAGEDVTKLLHFVRVKEGETWFVPAGTPHAIGPGLFLYEPQESSATTYRYYDFNRKDQKGKTRPLHIEEAIGCTDWEAPRGTALEKRLRMKGGNLLISSPEFRLLRFDLKRGTALKQETEGGVQGFTALSGKFEFTSQQSDRIVSVMSGESVILPACIGTYQIRSVSDQGTLLRVDIPPSVC